MATPDGKTAENGRRETEEKERSDTLIDRTLSCLDSLSRRMDAWEERFNKEDKAKKDAEEKEKEEKDAEEVEPLNKERHDAARADSMQPGEARDAFALRVRHELALAQERADKVATAHGQQSPAPMSGESTRGYRARLLADHKRFSRAWKDVDSDELKALPQATFDRAESQIYADSLAASYRPEVPPGELVERTIRWPDGRVITEFHGSPRAWMSQFSHKPMRCRINPRPNDGGR